MAEGTWVEKPKGKDKERQSQRMEQSAPSTTIKRNKPEDKTFRAPLKLSWCKMAVLIEGHLEKRLTEEQTADLELLIANREK